MSQPTSQPLDPELERQRARNRALMPGFAQFVDEYRAVFGEVKVIWARENGQVVGRPPAGEKWPCA